MNHHVAIGLRLLAIFFGFGACMCALALFLLLFPGTALDAAWQLNPDARSGFQTLGKTAVLLMLAVGVSCAAAAVGLWQGRRWGVRVAIAILTLNLVGDLLNALVRHDYRALIGVPISGAMIAYLAVRTRSGT